MHDAIGLGVDGGCRHTGVLAPEVTDIRHGFNVWVDCLVCLDNDAVGFIFEGVDGDSVRGAECNNLIDRAWIDVCERPAIQAAETPSDDADFLAGLLMQIFNLLDQIINLFRTVPKIGTLTPVVNVVT